MTPDSVLGHYVAVDHETRMSPNAKHSNAIPFHVAELLRQSQRRLVLAESCTCGLIAALLGQVPGISQHFCGSAVTYREGTKHAWLGVSHTMLQTHSAVSHEVTATMAVNVLHKTPEADLSLAITGHLGPDVAMPIDGCVFVYVATRTKHQSIRQPTTVPDETTGAIVPAGTDGAGIAILASRTTQLQTKERVARQDEAVRFALSFLAETLSAHTQATT